MNKPIQAVELFAGAGGLALGLEQSGIEHTTLIELDKDCVNTLRINRPQWSILHKNIRDINFCSFNGIDVITGGFPCQSFSHAGKRLGVNDSRGDLVYEFIRAVREIRPKCFLGENVKGLLHHNNGATLKDIKVTLERLGYVISHKVLNAVNYNVPQKRERLIIVGIRCDLQVTYKFPTAYPNVVTLREALQECPDSPHIKYSPQREKVLRLVPPGGCWVNLPLDIQKEYMGASYYSGGGKRGAARRLHWDEPCHTLMTSATQKLTDRCHPEETRPLSIRECARVQTFPDSWVFTGGIQSQYKQIGNAVPVLLAKALGSSIIDALIHNG